MRKLVYYIATSMDGFIAAPDGDFSMFPMNPELLAALFGRYPETCPTHLREPLGITAPNARFDTVIMGAQTHQPAIDIGLTSAYPHLQQIVVSNRDFPADETVEFWQGDIAAKMTDLTTGPGGDIWLCGGSDLATQLADQIDEIQLKINPITLGTGKPLFGGDYTLRSWELVSAEPLPGGVVLVTWRRPE